MDLDIQDFTMSDVSLRMMCGAESHSTSPQRSSRSGATGPFGWAVELLLVFIFTTMVMMTYVARLENDDQLHAMTQHQRAKTLDRLRQKKLTQLQQTIFVNPKRPPDHTYKINVTLSESISLERNVTDFRNDQCLKFRYDIDKLPTVTVIIPIYNDALSLILRTVHSVLMRTPEKLLSQVILVNDASPNEDLHEPLERYVKLLPRKVILIHLKRREGLMRARNAGAAMATGDVLFFQDAHTEANSGWAEPLLYEIMKNPKTVIQPTVDRINQDTIEYMGQKHLGVVPRGGFTWDLRYIWMPMPEHEKKRLNYEHEYRAHRTPTLVGCAFGIRKDYFLSIGGFDDDMHIWGAENIEVAFRVWLCGGQVLTHPCSHVAHTFKSRSYVFDGDGELKTVQKNKMRVAELWMDDWKKFVLASTYNWPKQHTYLTDEELKSLEKRKALKRNLQCKGFEWYMENIVPEIPTPPMDAVFYGEVFNLASELCFYLASDGYVALTNFCYIHRVVPQNIFYIDKLKRLKYGSKCVVIERSTKLMRVEDCPMADNPPAEIWETIRHSEIEGMITVRFRDRGSNKETTLCPIQVTNILPVHNKQQMPQLHSCKKNDRLQKWRWSYVFDFNYNWQKPVAKSNVTT